MIKYLVCGLDDENYTMPDFSIFCDINQAKNDMSDFLRSNDYEIDEERSASGLYRLDGHDEDNGFYVSELFSIDVEPGDYLVIYHHAYNGVDFEVSSAFKTHGDAYAYMKSQYDSFMDDFSEYVYPDDCDIDNASAIIDDGQEWHMWDIFQV